MHTLRLTRHISGATYNAGPDAPAVSTAPTFLLYMMNTLMSIYIYIYIHIYTYETRICIYIYR